MGSKITADGDCSHVIKGRLLLGKKPMTKLDSVFKSRDISLPTKVCLVKVMVLPVVMYGCETWIIKKTEHLRIDAFELWCWKRLYRVPWTTRRSNQPILKEINLYYSQEGLMADAEGSILQPPSANSHLIGKDPDSGKDWGQEEKRTIEDEMRAWHHWLNGQVWANSEKWWRAGKPGMLQSMGSQRVELLVIEQQGMTR